MRDLKLTCDKLLSLVSDAKTATINTAPHMHICVSILWTSVFLWRFDDNKKASLFPTTLLYISEFHFLTNHVYNTRFHSNLHQISSNCKYRKGTSIRQAPVFRHLRALQNSPWKFIIWMNELYIITLHVAGFLHPVIFHTSITVLTNQVWKLLFALFKVLNTGAFMVKWFVHSGNLT